MLSFDFISKRFLVPLFYNSVNFLYPLRCQFCHKYLEAFPVKYLCSNCHEQLMKHIVKVCVICNKEAPVAEKTPFICKSCLNKPIPNIIFLSAGPYEGILKELIHQLKYNHKHYIAYPLSIFLLDFIALQNIDLKSYDYIVPVPLSKTRLRDRGFNQSELIAKELSKWSKIPIKTNVVFRKYHKHQQVSLNRTERLNNLAGVFKINKKFLLQDKSLILIDDVKSTGSTIYFCSEKLFNAGVKKILSLTLANNA